MSHRGDPRLPTADQIERHGLKDWAHRLVLRLYERFRDIDDDISVTQGTWTPALTFDTPGDLSVTYSVQEAYYIIRGKEIFVHFDVQASVFTHSTASGSLSITGLPFAADATYAQQGLVRWQGITKAGYTQCYVAIPPAAPTTFRVLASGSGVAGAAITIADMPTGGTPFFIGNMSYLLP